MFGRASLCTLTTSFLLVATGGLGSEYELVKVIAERKRVMFDMQGAYWPLLAVKNGKSTDLAAAAEAARSIQAALDRFSPLLVPGTAKGQVPGSRATPEVWSEPADFAAASNALKAAAAALSDAASTGDVELFTARFDTFASACTGCHEFKPSGGGRFRAPFRTSSQ
jgi:cytochrome c556